MLERVRHGERDPQVPALVHGTGAPPGIPTCAWRACERRRERTRERERYQRDRQRFLDRVPLPASAIANTVASATMPGAGTTLPTARSASAALTSMLSPTAIVSVRCGPWGSTVMRTE